MEASFPAGWKYRCKLSYSLYYTGYSDLTNFPILFIWTGSQATSNLPQAMFDADGSTPAKNGGGDIRITFDKYGKVPIAFERKTFTTDNDPSVARAEIWVKFPTVYWDKFTPIYIWWGNSIAVDLTPDDTYGYQNVWDSNYKMVMHLPEASAPYYDVTINNNYADASSTNVTLTSSGKIAGAQSFNSSVSPAFLHIPNNSSLNITSSITLSAWVNATDWSSNRRILQKGNNDNQYRLLCEGGVLKTTLTGLTAVDATAVLPSTGAFHYICSTYDGTNIKLWVDAANVATVASTGSISTTTDALNIGHKPGSGVNGDSMLGVIDEVRISDVARSSDWILTEYTNQNDPAGSTIIGTTETLGVLSGWKRVCALTQDRTKLAGDEYDIQVPLIWTGSAATSNLPQEMFDADGVAPAKSDGADVRFSTDPNGAEECAFEIVSFSTNNDPSVARAEIWVRCKFLSSSTNTKIYVWYNNPSAAAIGANDTQGVRSCWRDNTVNYLSVHHMDGSGDVSDSANNVYGLTNSGSTSTTGKLGGARALNGSSQYLETGDYYVTGNGYKSIFFWAYLNNTNVAGLVTYGINAESSEWGMLIQNNHWYLWGWGGGNDFDSGITPSTGQWYYVVATYDGTKGHIYVNGSELGTGYTHNYNTQIGPLRVGRAVDGASTYYFNGNLDEIQVASSSTSANRITSMYNSQNSPQTFWSVGAPNSYAFPYLWNYRVKLTQDHTKNLGDIQANFVSLLAWTGTQSTSNLPQAMFDADGGGAAKSDGSDLRITSDEEGITQIPFEVVTFSTNNSPSSARAEIYVKVPQVSHTTDVNIYVWWGNPQATAYRTYDLVGRDAVWSDFLMVFHFESTTLTDSAGNGYDAANTDINTTAGRLVGNAGAFNGSSSFAQVGNIAASVQWSYWGTWYISAWTYYDSFPNYSRIIDFANSGNPAGGDNLILYAQDSTNTLGLAYFNNTDFNYNEQPGVIPTATWTHLSGRYFNGNLGVGKDGNTIGIETAAATPLRNILRDSAFIGKSNWVGDSLFDGRIDELRIMKKYDPNYRYADYNSQSSPSTYWSVSQVVPVYGTNITLAFNC